VLYESNEGLVAHQVRNSCQPFSYSVCCTLMA
jgi:hypothetical protein